MSRTGTFCQNNRARIHNIVQMLRQIHPNDPQPILRQGLERRSQSVQPVRKWLDSWAVWETIPASGFLYTFVYFCMLLYTFVYFCILVDCLLLESPLADAPQVYPDTLSSSVNWGRKLLL